MQLRLKISYVFSQLNAIGYSVMASRGLVFVERLVLLKKKMNLIVLDILYISERSQPL
jgi:hypothetical protein